MPTKQDILDLHFMEARCKLIDLAAFLDRIDRHSGAEDYRDAALREALPLLLEAGPGRARRVLEKLSDPSREPVSQAPSPAAFGAPQPTDLPAS
jgi:hypothetical protein